MSLIVPSVIKKDINKYSGFLDSQSKYGGKSLKGLFWLPENHEYLSMELYQMITNKSYVHDVTNDSYLAGRFVPYREQLSRLVPRMVEEWQLPYREDLAIRNPIQQLHTVNFEFLRTTSKNIIQNPNILIADIYDYNPETGSHDNPEYSYGAASYSDGTWHPEHLFTQSKKNRANPYWKPLSVTFDTNPPADVRGEGFHPRENHYSLQNRNIGRTYTKERFANDYEKIDGSAWDDLNSAQDLGFEEEIPNLQSLLQPSGGPPGPGNRYMYDYYGDKGFKDGGVFPRWQYSVNHRNYDRDISDGLDEGGNSDRRTQTTRGYNMSSLLSKSSY